MINLYDSCKRVSENLMSDIFALWNNIDKQYEIYIVSSFIPKSNINQYHELEGVCITDILQKSTLQDITSENLLLKVEQETSLETIRFMTDDWYWIKSRVSK